VANVPTGRQRAPLYNKLIMAVDEEQRTPCVGTIVGKDCAWRAVRHSLVENARPARDRGKATGLARADGIAAWTWRYWLRTFAEVSCRRLKKECGWRTEEVATTGLLMETSTSLDAVRVPVVWRTLINTSINSNKQRLVAVSGGEEIQEHQAVLRRPNRLRARRPHHPDQ
jgi:hypothetical protein